MTALGELDGVTGEVEENLFEPARVAQQHFCMRRRGQDESQPFAAGHAALDAGDVLKQRPELERMIFDPQFSGLDAGKIQDITENAQQELAGRTDLVHHGSRMRRQRLTLEDLGESQDRIEGGANFMTHIGEEAVLGLVRTFGHVPSRL